MTWSKLVAASSRNFRMASDARSPEGLGASGPEGTRKTPGTGVSTIAREGSMPSARTETRPRRLGI